jgi:bacillithiol biosynthesis cysteine-adding enzyme BshC
MSVRFDPVPPAAAPPGARPFELAAAAQAGRAFPPAAAGALLASEGSAAARARDALLAGKALVVTTGQQPGLFTGPLYTVHKALTAVALAEALAARWNRVVVPVFWVAGDDHDFAEINHCAVLAADGALRTIALRERAPDAPMLPAYREPLGPDGARALEALGEALPPSEFQAETLAWLGAAYTPGRSVAEAHAAALADLLSSLGVVVCRGWDGELKRGAGPVLLEALRSARTLDEALAREAARLEQAGEDVLVDVGQGMTLVMMEGSLGRDRLRLADGGFVTRRSGEKLALPDLETMIRTAPSRLSANVLLRPVVEAYLLPTVAYIGGPAELSYLRQVGPVFAHLAVPRPVPTPRLSGFVVEAKVEKALARFELSARDLERPEGELASAVVRGSLPGHAIATLEGLRAALVDGYAALSEAAVGIEPTLKRPVETARNQALHAVDEVEKRLVGALKRSNEGVLQQLARARTSLYPDGQPQERVLTLASYLARYGRPFLEVLGEAAAAHAGRLLEGPTTGV